MRMENYSTIPTDRNLTVLYCDLSARVLFVEEGVGNIKPRDVYCTDFGGCLEITHIRHGVLFFKLNCMTPIPRGCSLIYVGRMYEKVHNTQG